MFGLSDNSPTNKPEKSPIVKQGPFRYFLRFVEPAEKTLQNAVAERLEALNTNAFAFEQSHGLPEDAVRSILNGTKKLGTTLNKAQAVCAALGLELYIGRPRETEPVEKILLAGKDYAHIPLHDALLAAGGGAQNDSEQIIDQLAFRSDWLKRMRLPASKARLARVQGDSMQPTMWHGDMILIDTQITMPPVRAKDGRDLRRSPVYALLDNGEARVKRIERPADDLLMLISDNPDYAPELRQSEDINAIQIIGRVVWWGHTDKD